MRKRSLPWGARGYISCAVLAAAVCAAPALRDPGAVQWPVAALLAAVYAGSEWLPRCPLLGHRVPPNIGPFLPALLAAALLLPPGAAALVPIAGALLGRVGGHAGQGHPHAAARRIWHAAQLALACCAAASTHTLLSGETTLAQFASSTESAQPAQAASYATDGLLHALPPAIAATLVFSAVLAALDGGILVAAERCSPRTAWRGHLPRSLAPHLVQGLAGLMMAVLWRSPYGAPAALCVLLPMYIGCCVFAQYHRERTAHQATIRALVQAVDLKDRYTRGHSERVGRASALIATELGMDADRLEALRFAGILHDVGKLGVPTRVLRKEGPLTPEERRVIELHPEYGHEVVRGIGFLGEARAAILHHHERLDGSGYPYGLRGREIPEFARVVAVADAFDAMTSTRSYRRARPVPDAVAELKRCAGSQFDSRMVRALARALERQGWSPAVTADETGESVPRARTTDVAVDVPVDVPEPPLDRTGPPP